MTHLAFKTRLNFEPSLPLPRVFFSQNSDTRTLGHSDLTLSRITAVFRPTIYFEMAQN